MQHLAAQRNHLNCVSFLVNFGCNIWSLDNEEQTALDEAGLRGHEEVVKYLDTAMAHQLALNPKDVEKKKIRALKEASKRMKEFERNDAKRNRNKPKFIVDDQNHQNQRIPPGANSAQTNPVTLRQIQDKFRTLGIRTFKQVSANPTYSQHVMQEQRGVMRRRKELFGKGMFNASYDRLEIFT